AVAKLIALCTMLSCCIASSASAQQKALSTPPILRDILVQGIDGDDAQTARDAVPIQTGGEILPKMLADLPEKITASGIPAEHLRVSINFVEEALPPSPQTAPESGR